MTGKLNGKLNGKGGPKGTLKVNGKSKPVTLTAPERKPYHVALIALGPSSEPWMRFAESYGGRRYYCDEVWTVNTFGDVLAHDMLWHMDDVRIQEIRAAADPDGKIARMLKWLKTHPGPIMTSRAHPDYPGLVEFPLEAVINALGSGYFNSTTAYAIAYAIYKGATRLSLFGLDFTYPDAHVAEKGRGCCEFWVGHAMARGVAISVCDKSTFMDTYLEGANQFYGYDTQDVGLEMDGARAKLTFAEKAVLPTAAEIEDRYDHTKHPTLPNRPAIPSLVVKREPVASRPQPNT